MQSLNHKKCASNKRLTLTVHKTTHSSADHPTTKHSLTSPQATNSQLLSSVQLLETGFGSRNCAIQLLASKGLNIKLFFRYVSPIYDSQSDSHRRHGARMTREVFKSLKTFHSKSWLQLQLGKGNKAERKLSVVRQQTRRALRARRKRLSRRSCEDLIHLTDTQHSPVASPLQTPADNNIITAGGLHHSRSWQASRLMLQQDSSHRFGHHGNTNRHKNSEYHVIRTCDAGADGKEKEVLKSRYNSVIMTTVAREQLQKLGKFFLRYQGEKG